TAEPTFRRAASAPVAGAASAKRRGPRLGDRRSVGTDDALAHVGDVRYVPDAALAGHAAKVRRAVRESRRGLRWPGGSAASAFLRADPGEERQQRRNHRADARAAGQALDVD